MKTKDWFPFGIIDSSNIFGSLFEGIMSNFYKPLWYKECERKVWWWYRQGPFLLAAQRKASPSIQSFNYLQHSNNTSPSASASDVAT